MYTTNAVEDREKEKNVMFNTDPSEKIYPYMAGEDESESEDYDDEAAEEQSEDHDDRGSDPEPVQT